MNYTTYWSILDAPSHAIKPNSVCLVIAIGFGLLWLLTKKFKKDKGEGDKLILLWGTGVFAVIGIIGYFAMTFVYKDKTDSYTLKMLNSPETLKVEGVVANFQRTYRDTKYASVTTESFTVDSVRFSYTDAVLGRFNAFSETGSQVIFDGQKVRISYKTISMY